MAVTNKENQKTMDVSKPGKVLPDASARPVIITHRPMVQDPMVKSDDTNDAPAQSSDNNIPISSGAHGNKVIKPVSESLEAAEEKKSDSDPESESPVADQDKDTESDNSAEAAIVEAVADQAQPGVNKKDGHQTEEDKAKAEHLQKLVATKTYFLPIGQVARRRNRRAVIIFLSVLLLTAAGGYAAVDSGIIKTNVKLPIDLIKN